MTTIAPQIPQVIAILHERLLDFEFQTRPLTEEQLGTYPNPKQLFLKGFHSTHFHKLKKIGEKVWKKNRMGQIPKTVMWGIVGQVLSLPMDYENRRNTAQYDPILRAFNSVRPHAKGLFQRTQWPPWQGM